MPRPSTVNNIVIRSKCHLNFEVVYILNLQLYKCIIEKKKCVHLTLISKQIHLYTHTHTHPNAYKNESVLFDKKSADWMNRKNSNQEEKKTMMVVCINRKSHVFVLFVSSSLSIFILSSSSLIFSPVPGKKLLHSIYLEQQSEFDWHWLCEKWFLVSKPIVYNNLYIYIYMYEYT